MKVGWFQPVAILLVTGCTVGPDPVTPDIGVADTFENRPGVPIPPIRDDWYTSFEDPVLVELAEAALANNIGLSAARANLAVARANATAASADLLPTLDGFSNTQISGPLSGGVDADTNLSTGLSLDFDPDISGRNKRSLEAATARFDAAALSVADLRRLIVEDLVLEYISLRRAGARLTLLDENLDLQARTLEIVQARFDAGLSPALDVDRAAADFARSRAQRGQLEASRKQAGFALSVLTGEPPRSDQFGDPASDIIPSYGADPEPGIPADLLRNRADVRQAEAILLVETALIGVETADLYPSLRIPGTLTGRTGSGADDLNFSFGALIDVPMLDFGRRQAELEAQEARALAALENYKLTVLDAQQDVEAALTQVDAFRQQRAELQNAGERSQAAYDQLDALYREGLAGFIDVLDAQRTLIQIREQIVDSDAAIASSLARLSAALGGF
ncbi:MAG: TolC family protein [Pseudomonadota bacterium]